jgi:hypothetical protein
MILFAKIAYSLLLCLLMINVPAFAESQAVGHINFAKGSNAAQLPGASPRILGIGAEIFQGDNIQTTESSFVIVEFTDGSKVTVRPNSNFSIDHYDSQSANKSAQLVLHQGGVNASTGAIAKDHPESFQIKTPSATVKPKSDKAEFIVRICDKECENKGKEAAEAPRTEQSVVARVVDIKGKVNAINRADKGAKERQLSLGKSLYNTDSVHSEKDSYALMLFPDGHKITLNDNSNMDIKEYDYQIKGKKDQVLLGLTTGGLRSLTGAIGKNDHDAYTLNTPVATIGIRGSGHDTETDGTKLQHSTWKDATYVQTKDGQKYTVTEGQTLSMDNPNATPVIYNTPPASNANASPRPDNNKSDPKTVFGGGFPSDGDTLTDAMKGSATVENSYGDTTTVEEGQTSSATPKGITSILDYLASESPVNNNLAVDSNSFNLKGLPADTSSTLLNGCTI